MMCALILQWCVVGVAMVLEIDVCDVFGYMLSRSFSPLLILIL